MYEIRILKNKLREEYRERRRALPKEVKESRDSLICKRFLTLTSYRYAKTLLVYAPTGEEIDIFPIIRDALEKGKNVAFPKCCPENSTMVYKIISSADDLSKGCFGLMEPDDSLPSYEGDGTDAICIIPAIVYDKKGYRIGYGKGYYDRYLSSFKGIKAGVGYSDFMLDSVPHGRFDLTVDVLITEKGVKSFV
ncbi:MAG: 5-formyltetrahydrofolate cyclo-ligase [Ruminococcaceae bacterium]|nr:5-formyltetrahydrofolate cyclo-ligase [Oscillospiraceae bacterium]